MLKLLRIDNFALIEQIEIPFAAGLNVLTGETGAGKSIILDALDALLGGAVSAKVIRTGASKAAIEAVFETDPALLDWLHEQEIDPLDEGIVCLREIGDRTSRSRVNGVLVNRQQIQSLRAKLVEITAQGQTLQLQDPATQRRWLDGFGKGSKLAQARQSVYADHQTWHQLKLNLEQRQKAQQERLQRLDILQFQAQELDHARLQDADELTRLEQERDRLDHSVELQKVSAAAYQLLYQAELDAPAAADQLGKAERMLQEMVRYDPELAPIVEMVSSALIQAEEAGRALHDYHENLEADPARLHKIERRIQHLKQLCRKYGPTLADVICHAEQVVAELRDLEDDGSSLEALEANVQEARRRLEQSCAALSKLRQQAATRLEKSLVAELQPLGMSAVRFEVHLAPIPPTSEGSDQITFVFSPNPGEPLRPLSDIASGGEMSRFLLALKAVFSQVDPVATMVFDEIDAGVSGKLAQAIATKLHAIARHHQILCVTHQPLIAALADHHMRVSKIVQRDRTRVHVDPLSDPERRDELAQLTAGHSAQEAIPFVEALLAQAALLRAS